MSRKHLQAMNYLAVAVVILGLIAMRITGRGALGPSLAIVSLFPFVVAIFSMILKTEMWAMVIARIINGLFAIIFALPIIGSLSKIGLSVSALLFAVFVMAPATNALFLKRTEEQPSTSGAG
mgnify:CR=1 FL=1